MEDNQKVQEIEPEQEEKPKPETSSTDKIQILQEGQLSITCIIKLSSMIIHACTSEVESFQNTAVKQLAELESILEKNEKIVKEPVQELTQVFAVSPGDIIPG